MWCFSCFKPSTPVDPLENDFDRALVFSRHEADIQEAEQVALAMEVSSREEEEEKRLTRMKEEEERRRTRMIEEERRRTRMIEEEEKRRSRVIEEERRRTRMIEEERRRIRMIEEDAQIANGFLYEDRERQINNNNSALEDEQIAKALAKSLKVKGKRKQFEEEQVKKDEELALIVQESLNNMVESPPRLAEIKNISARASLDEDEQLEKVIRESLKGKGLITQSQDEVEDVPKVNPPRSMCGGCNTEIENGRSVDVLGVLWHPECLWCDACHKSIAIHEIKNHVSNSRGKYHKSCYERYCYVCKEKKLKAYHEHHFWKERYCPAHDADGTHKCCSCERLEPRGTNYVMLGDSRRLCLECMDSAVMDTYEVQPLHFEIREYFEGLNMKIEKAFPFLLVEKQALNQAEKEEKIVNQYELVTRGICLSEAQTVTSVSKGPRIGLDKQLTGMATESQMVVRDCEVTAILILYGLPRLLTGYILAHEMMHAYLRLNGVRIVSDVMEEGICQVLGHMWLESQSYATNDANEAAAASSLASSSRVPPAAANESKKGECSDFEKKLVEFFKNQIEEDDSPVYGLGFKKVYKMVTDSNLQETLKEITRRG